MGSSQLGLLMFSPVWTEKAVRAAKPWMKGYTLRDGGFNTVLHTQEKCPKCLLCQFGFCTKLHQSPSSELPDPFQAAHYATHNTQEVYLFIGKIFFKEYFLFIWIGTKYQSMCWDVLKAKQFFTMSCYIDFTCKIVKMYLFCKMRGACLLKRTIPQCYRL